MNMPITERGFHVILEGPDNGGKTTLAGKIRATEPAPMYFHPGGRPADDGAEMECMAQQHALLCSDKALVLDRCTAISQQVYSPNPALAEIRRLWLEEAVATGAIVIYCRPNSDWLMSFENFTWREGETEEFKQEIIEKQHIFIDRYDEIMRRIPHIAYDYRQDDAELVVRHLQMALAGNMASQKFLHNISPYQYGGKSCA
jgi:hypothetical protein